MTKPVVSIEYGHTILDPTNRDATAIPLIRESARAAGKLVSLLLERGIDVQTTVLLDDKHLSPKLDRSNEANSLLGLLPLKPDVVVFESDLKLLAPAMLETIEEPRRSKLAGEIGRRSARGLSLACSVDITIWQLLRLGLLTANLDGRELPAFVSGLRTADMAISILAAHDKTYEERALRENLRSVREFCPQRSSNLYLASTDVDFVYSEQLNTFSQKIGERFHV